MPTTSYTNLLHDLHRGSLEIEASALISNDGMMIASCLPESSNENYMSAMSAAILSLGDRMVDNLLGGVTDRVMVQSSIGYIIVTSISTDLLLTVIARPDAKLGMVFHDIKNVSRKILLLTYGVA